MEDLHGCTNVSNHVKNNTVIKYDRFYMYMYVV